MSPRLSIIPAGAVTDSALEGRDLQVLCLLGRHTNEHGWCSRSQVKMAKELNCGRATLQRSLDRLYDAGWVQKKRRDPEQDVNTHPSSSYAYRVILDRDDAGNDHALRSKHGNQTPPESPDNEGCPPVGTPDIPASDGHPGAHAERAPGAHVYTGTKNDPLERPPIQRERDARAREVEEFLIRFRAKWPTAAVDDQQRLVYAAHELTDEERKRALDKIEPFLALLKSLKRTGIPAGWKFLEEKRWTMLDQQPEPAKSETVIVEPNTVEARALLALCRVALAPRPFRMSGDRMAYRGTFTPQLLALADVPPRERWIRIRDRQQLGAWTGFFQRYAPPNRARMESDTDGTWLLVPWPWPPRADGTLTDEPQEAEGAEQ